MTAHAGPQACSTTTTVCARSRQQQSRTQRAARPPAAGAVTTLGRGGSDLSATVLGAALDLKEVQVWKDVDGVLTSDPRIVSGTRPVCELTFEEATELAYFGAQVLHPAAMQPAIRSGKLNVRVKNSYNRWARAGCAARGGVGWPVMVRGASPGDGVSWSGWAAAGCWVLGAGC